MSEIEQGDGTLDGRLDVVEAKFPLAADDVQDGIFTAAKAASWPACKAYPAVGPTLTTATVTTVSLDTEYFDTDGIHDPTTNPSRLTCQTAGIYLLTAYGAFAANATGVRIIYIYLNGSFLVFDSRNATSAGGVSVSLSTIHKLSVGDYIEMKGYQTSGSNQGLAGSLGMVWLGKG